MNYVQNATKQISVFYVLGFL